MPDPENSKRQDMEDLYLTRIQAMSGEQRMEIAADLSQAVRELAIAGIRHRQPGLSEKELLARLLERIYG